MKATKAYIASLGTTGVLLGASILMLAVVSAVVAFDRWPSGTVSTRVQTLVIHDRAAPIPVTATTARRAAAAGIVRAAAPAVINAGGVGGQHFAGGRATPVAAPPGGPIQQVLGSRPPGPLPAPIVVPSPDPDTVRSQVADQTQSTAGSAGGTVGSVNSAAGQAITSAGAAAADALRQPPLPPPPSH